MEVNYFGTMNSINSVYNYYNDKKSGQISIISSVAGYRGLPAAGAYCASKSALTSFAESLHFEMKNVKSFSISPGIVDTDMQLKIRSAKEEEFPLLENFKNYHKNGDLEKAEDIAMKILYVIENQENFESNELLLREISI